MSDATWFAALRRRLVAWYAKHARDLPWRRTSDPYAVWLSEVMLQQTQVETVKRYFARFLERFPTIAALAAADEHDVLRLWEGLGYYRRARQLHAAAKVMVARHDGRFPDDLAAAGGLPGVGRYTAGAVLSIALGRRAPIVEANTLRLWSRLLAFEGDPLASAGQAQLWTAAEQVLPRGSAMADVGGRNRYGQINQALMELGSQVCLPRQPRCGECPLAALCGANLQGRQADIPRPKAKPAIRAVREAAVVVRRGSRLLLIRRPAGGRWAGLWDFPRFAIAAGTPAALRRELAAGVERLAGVSVRPGKLLQTLRHTVTRYRISLECYEAKCVTVDRPSTDVEMRWLRPGELEHYPLCTTGRQIARLVAAAD